MAQTNRILLTGGTHNRVLCSHTQLCQHCGYIGGGELAQKCSTCGIQAHEGCVPAFRDDMCDACHHPCEVCEVCLVDDTVSNGVPPNGVDRLVLLVAFHGRRWVQGEDDSRVLLSEDSDVAGHLAVDPDTSFQPQHLPDGGREPMRVVVNGIAFLSVPMMVHSWCVHSVFQLHPAPTGSPAWQTVAEGIDAPRRGSFAEASTQYKLGMVNEVCGCAFCGSTSGFQIFCYGHMNSMHGCNNCNWSLRPRFSYTSFHPSCAVRAGMYRVVDPVDGGCGMMCHRSMSSFLPKVHRMSRTRQMTARVQRVERWLQQSSGFHMDLVSRIDPVTLVMDLSQTLPVVGARYDTFPVARARRVVHRRHSSDRVHDAGTEIVDNVPQQPHQRPHHSQAPSHAEEQHGDDARHYDDHESREQGTDTCQPADRSVTTHSLPTRPLTLAESSELIQTLTSPRLLEAIDVRVQWFVERALAAERGVRACRELCEE